MWWLIVFLLAVGVVYLWRLRKDPRRLLLDPKSILDNYDYIVVGGGSAGCVVAGRLSEDPNATVLLLEAGGAGEDLLITTPGLCNKLQNGSLDWAFRTTEQKNSSQGLMRNQSNWPRGKVLGGSSSLNYMVWVRGNPDDFNLWAKMGCEGWAYKDVLPFFKRAEGYSGDRAEAKAKDLGTDGPLSVSEPRDAHPVWEDIIKAANKVGLKTNHCYNGPDQEGFGYCQVSQVNGERCSTARGYIYPNLRRPNLHVLTGAQVTRVNLFAADKSTLRATGVQFVRGSKQYNVNAKREVIVCAGAVQSPQILMLSGIGPAAHLEKVGIEVAKDLPVGENLQDHLMSLVPYEMKITAISKKSIVYPHRLAVSLLSYGLARKGLLSTNGLEVTGFLRSGLRNDLMNAPDLQIHGIASLGIRDDMVNVGTREEYFDPENEYKDGINLIPILLHPKSKGVIQLRSSDPLAAPIIEPNYLTHEDDVKTLIYGIRVCEKLMKQPELAHLSPKALFPPTFSQEEGEKDDAFWEKIVRHFAVTVYHPIGTCKMGANEDKTAVVDSRLRVKGVSNLRVADASIMPTLISGNTNAACVMVGEKAAHMIAEDWRGKKI